VIRILERHKSGIIAQTLLLYKLKSEDLKMRRFSWRGGQACFGARGSVAGGRNGPSFAVATAIITRSWMVHADLTFAAAFGHGARVHQPGPILASWPTAHPRLTPAQRGDAAPRPVA